MFLCNSAGIENDPENPWSSIEQFEKELFDGCLTVANFFSR
jgi:hypothetical protein